MLTSTDPNGVITTWTYMPRNKPATVSYSGSSAHSVSYGYDANGNKTSMTDATGSSSYVYDPFGELTSATNGAGQVTGYAYNAAGELSEVTYPLPATATWATTDTVNYTHDNAGLVTKATDFNGNAITIGNTADGLQNSVSVGSTGDTISTTYDNTDAPSAIALKNSTSTLQSFTYTDSPVGTILNETDTPSSSRSPAVYTYDANGRVTSMTSGTGTAQNYSFDASSNLTTLPTGATGAYDKGGELASATFNSTTTSYTYNADGEQLNAKQGSDTIASGTWNGAAQLFAYSSAAANMTSATYDGGGVRAADVTSSTPEAFDWNTIPSVPQLIMDSGNAYVYTTGNTPAEQVNLTTGAITYLIADSLGSVRGALNSAGNLTGTTSYDAWGNPETAGGLTSTTPFGYAGGYTDPTGLIYLINRYYSPQTGQFLSVDPLLVASLAPYDYANDNPITGSDPNGLLKGVMYAKQCADVGCIRISKKCRDSLKYCMLYWQAGVKGIYKAATKVVLYKYSIQVNGNTVYGPIAYGHAKIGKQKFHGHWGYERGWDLGRYKYSCYIVLTCTAYMNSTDEVTFNGDASITMPSGKVYNPTSIYGDWASGTVVPWSNTLEFPRI